MAGYIQTSKSIEWSTPQELFDKLNKEFNFTVDVASTDENTKCEKHYTLDTDGLSQKWGGRKGLVQSSLWKRNAKVDKKGL